MSHLPAVPLFDLKSTAWLLTALRLHSADAAALGAALDQRFADSPGLFDDEPLVVDLSPLRDGEAVPDFAALLAHLARHRMRAVAAQGGNAAQMDAARAAGLPPATEPEVRHEARPEPETREVVREVEVIREVEVPVPAAAATTLIVDKPLRSGQRVYARGGDLVVLSVVSFGAEVIADGSIHVYAPLRGRAIAGARGDADARIFSTCMEPQLVSVAGMYRTTETPLADDVLGKPAQVRLEGERLVIEPLAVS
ncbi:septum site-determining protein MinC [Rubrivivax gelatinosus]|uniref:Probable septum site-determining protein MinC n=1 Tax=Rubrivivax gelatinosus TaxID=28068 RepID=A0ABS1DPB9_RUBGE|nr:septum site-determining protein MinC [Rubrivivax gelatinosus]MBK1711853.1 septum site-determining protein MinC [Rubrivivax gelatinosus]